MRGAIWSGMALLAGGAVACTYTERHLGDTPRLGDGDSGGGTSDGGAPGDAFAGDTAPPGDVGCATPAKLLMVREPYPDHDWTDYVLNDGADEFSASGLPCTGAEIGGYDVCLHAGEIREVVAPTDLTSCAGVTLVEELGAFTWVCDDSTSPVVFRTSELESTHRLADLLTPAGWRQNRVYIGDPTCPDYASPLALWWQNTVRPVSPNADPMASTSNVTTLDAPGVYVVGTSMRSDGFNLDTDHVAFVVMPGAVLRYSGEDAPSHDHVTGESAGPRDRTGLVSTGGQDFLWIEGDFDAGSFGLEDAVNADYTVHLVDTRFSVVRMATSADSGGAAYRLRTSRNNRLTKIISVNGQTAGLRLGDVEGGDVAETNTIEDVLVAAAGSQCVTLFENADRNSLRGITCVSAADENLVVEGDFNTFGLLTCTDAWMCILVGDGTGMGRGVGNVFDTVVAGAAMNSSSAIHLWDGADQNLFRNVLVRDFLVTGLEARSDDNTFDAVRVESCGQAGFSGIWLNGDRNRLTNSSTVSGGETGLTIAGDQSVVVNLVTANNLLDGVSVRGAQNTLVSILAVNNSRDGLSFNTDAARNTLAFATIGNNAADGISLDGNAMGINRSNTLAQILLVNNGTDGMDIDAGSQHNNYFTLASMHHEQDGVEIGDASCNDQAFYGILLVGDNAGGSCGVTGPPTNPGIVDGTCTVTGMDGDQTLPPGSATFRPSRSAAATFKGKITVDDLANDDDTLGSAFFDTITDWSSFDNRYRAWGRDGMAFPSPSNRAACVSPDTCRIWDWRLLRTDTTLRDRSGDGANPNATFSGGSSCPPAVGGDVVAFDQQAIEDIPAMGGNDDGTCDPGEACLAEIMDGFGNNDGVCEALENCHGNVFLRNAIEAIDDPNGDGDGLCESGETCIYAPNIGLYQGEGTMLPQCVHNNLSGPGVVTNVTIWSFATNGAN